MTFKLDHEAEWRSFEQQVVPNDADPIQRREMKLCFISGLAAGYIDVLTVLRCTDSDLINEARLEDEIAAIKSTLRGMDIPL